MNQSFNKDKVVVITGGAKKIGRATAKKLADQGFNILIHTGGKSIDEAKKTVAIVKEYGVQSDFIDGDLADIKTIDKIKSAAEKLGTPSVLINNAGLLRNGFFTELSLADQEQMIAVNVLALTSLTHLYANKMAASGGGHILNVASLAGWMAIPNQNVYAATKAYVLAFTQALSNEMMAANTGVQVTALCPGYTATKMMDNPEQGATLRIPASMMMSAREVAEMGIKGCLAGKDLIVPGIANKFTASITHFFSKSLLTKLLGSFYRKTMG